MNNSIKSFLAAIVISTAFAGNASANVSNQTLQSAVQSALGSEGQVQVTVKNGVAHLVGYVNTRLTEGKVKRAALKHPSVDSIVDLIVAG